MNEDFLGSVIHGTMRLQDTMPVFIDLLCHIDKEKSDEFCESHANLLAAKDDEESDYWESEEALWDCEDMFYALNSLAPEGYYFGSHPGDGSDYGFWEVEE